MNTQALPLWVLQNPGKYTSRMTKEMAAIRASYTHAEFYLENGILYIEAKLCTRSWNQYLVRIYYPNDYPYNPPVAILFDRDVIQYCTGPQGGRHNFHNYGVSEMHGGLMLCVMNPSDNGTIGHGWQPKDMSAKTILERAVLWLHAYEVKRADPSKSWALPE